MAYLLSDEPWRKLYPSEDVQSSAHLERRSIVIDCYFNTSDKGVSQLVHWGLERFLGYVGNITTALIILLMF